MKTSLDVLKIIFNRLLKFIFTRQDFLLMKIGLFLNYKNYSQRSIRYKGTKLWNSLSSDLLYEKTTANVMHFCKSTEAVFTQQLIVTLSHNSLSALQT